MTSVRGGSGSGWAHLVAVHESFTVVSSRVAPVGLCVLAIGIAVLESIFLVPTHVARVFTKLLLVLHRCSLIASFHVFAQIDTILLHPVQVAAHLTFILPCISAILTRIG
jgi:hypothetical protein